MLARLNDDVHIPAKVVGGVVLTDIRGLPPIPIWDTGFKTLTSLNSEDLKRPIHTSVSTMVDSNGIVMRLLVDTYGGVCLTTPENYIIAYKKVEPKFEILTTKIIGHVTVYGRGTRDWVRAILIKNLGCLLLVGAVSNFVAAIPLVDDLAVYILSNIQDIGAYVGLESYVDLIYSVDVYDNLHLTLKGTTESKVQTLYMYDKLHKEVW